MERMEEYAALEREYDSLANECEGIKSQRDSLEHVIIISRETESQLREEKLRLLSELQENADMQKKYEQSL